MQAIEHFKTILWYLQHRRGMYVADGYIPLISFLEGFGLALQDAYHIDLLSEFQSWIQFKRKRRFSTHWAY